VGASSFLLGGARPGMARPGSHMMGKMSLMNIGQ
jgi:hypothetical protein